MNKVYVRPVFVVAFCSSYALSGRHYFCICIWMGFCATWLRSWPFGVRTFVTMISRGLHHKSFFDGSRLHAPLISPLRATCDFWAAVYCDFHMPPMRWIYYFWRAPCISTQAQVGISSCLIFLVIFDHGSSISGYGFNASGSSSLIKVFCLWDIRIL